MFSSKRRFIAGAVCPRCSQMDKIVAFNEGGKDYRECVSCGFKEPLHLQSPARELDTRVNRSARDIERQTRVVRLLDPE